MSTRISVMGLGLCTVLAAACVETEATPLSEQTLEALRSYGVHDVIHENEVVVLLDVHGTPVGAVTRDGVAGYAVELHGYSAQSNDNDASIDFVCEGEAYTLSRSSDGDWVPADSDTPVPAQACLDALAVGLLVTADVAPTVPLAKPASGCSSFSGWIWGFDCLGCFASIPGSGFPHTSCSYGWASTSCTKSTCPINHYEAFEVEASY